MFFFVDLAHYDMPLYIFSYYVPIVHKKMLVKSFEKKTTFHVETK